MASAEFARLEWPLLDLLCQLDSGDRYHCIVESLESQHRPDSLLHSPMVLLHHMVQVLAGSNLDASRKFAVVLHLPHRTMRGRIGVQRDLRGHASVLHRAAQKRFGGVHVSVPTEKEIHRLARFVDGAVQVHPFSADLYIALVHPPRSAHGPGVAPPPLFEFWKVALHPSQDRCVGHGDPPIRHHDHQIPRAQFEARVPAHAQDDDLSVEVPSLEQIFDRGKPLHLFIIARHLAFAPEPVGLASVPFTPMPPLLVAVACPETPAPEELAEAPNTPMAAPVALVALPLIAVPPATVPFSARP